MIKDTYRILFTAEKTTPCKLEAICIHSLVRQMKTPHPILKASPGVALWLRSSCTGLGQRHPNTPKRNTVIHFGGQGNKNIEALKNHDLLKAWPLSQRKREHIYFSNREMAGSSHSAATVQVSPDGSAVKNPPPMQETQKTQVRSLGWEDPLQEEMATHSNSYLENPTGRGAWWALQSTKTRTWLSDLVHAQSQVKKPNVQKL